MLDTIIIILTCILLLSGIGDMIFKVFGFGVKLFLGIVLVAASIWLTLKFIVVAIPWILALGIIGIIVSVLWLLMTLTKLS